MAIELRKMKIKSQYYDVVTYEDYANNPQIYDINRTAIMDTDNNIALPLLGKSDNTSIGIKFGGLVSGVKYPETDEEKSIYSLENMIDMSHPKNYKEVIETSQQLKDVEREILLTVDNITTPVITDEDSPAMRGLKETILAKQCDQDSYAHRFGPNYPNDKRILKDKDVSLKKIVKYGDSMDFEVSMTFKDKNPDVANPMGKEITVVLTGQGVNGGYE